MLCFNLCAFHACRIHHSRRETHCDFCRQQLPDWKDILTPDSDTTSAPAVMNVNFDNKTYSFTVRMGPSEATLPGPISD